MRGYTLPWPSFRDAGEGPNVINGSVIWRVATPSSVSGYAVLVPQLRRPVGAAESAALRHHGSGDQTATCNGETADGSEDSLRLSCGCGAAVVPGVPGLLSHTAALEASATGLPAPPRPALADPAAAVRPPGHDL